MGFLEMLPLLGKGLWETLYMTVGSTALAYLIGLPLGLLLAATAKEGLYPCPVFNRILGIGVNLLRSVPFIILLVWVMPITRAVMGTTIGSKATLVPLIIVQQLLTPKERCEQIRLGIAAPTERVCPVNFGGLRKCRKQRFLKVLLIERAQTLTGIFLPRKGNRLFDVVHFVPNL